MKCYPIIWWFETFYFLSIEKTAMWVKLGNYSSIKMLFMGIYFRWFPFDCLCFTHNIFLSPIFSSRAILPALPNGLPPHEQNEFSIGKCLVPFWLDSYNFVIIVVIITVRFEYDIYSISIFPKYFERHCIVGSKDCFSPNRKKTWLVFWLVIVCD